MKWAAAFVVGVLTVGGCGTERSGGDSSALLACRHFRNVARDAGDGLFTNAELRSKLKEVESDARYSDDVAISSGARAMVAAITTGTLNELESSVEGFEQSCSRLGF